MAAARTVTTVAAMFMSGSSGAVRAVFSFLTPMTRATARV